MVKINKPPCGGGRVAKQATLPLAGGSEPKRRGGPFNVDQLVHPPSAEAETNGEQPSPGLRVAKEQPFPLGYRRFRRLGYSPEEAVQLRPEAVTFLAGGVSHRKTAVCHESPAGDTTENGCAALRAVAPFWLPAVA